MKKFIYHIVFINICFISYGQVDIDNTITREGNKQENTNSLFQGYIDEVIPINNYKGRELDVPIAIKYTTDGIKVNEVASSVGLGWDLIAGGNISVVVNQNIDSPTTNSPPSSCMSYDASLDGYGNPYRSDFFSVNAPGLSCIFQYTSNIATHEPVCLTDPFIKIEASNFSNDTQANTFKITDKEGTQYFFGFDNKNEVNESISYFSTLVALPNGQVLSGYCDDIRISYYNNYLLTKIISKNKLDEYTFEYDDYNWQYYIPNSGEGYSFNSDFGNSDDRINESAYKLKQKMLKKIKHNGEDITLFNYIAREDLVFEGGANIGNALDEIQFLNYKSTLANPVYKKAKFNYSYFGNVTSTQTKDKRLKLDSLVFYGYDNVSSSFISKDQYSYIYHEPYNVPPVNSFAQDFMGFYNSQNSNVNLIPNSYSGDSENNRNFNFNSAKTGILTRIDYPHGGYKIFEYEQNAQGGGYGQIFVPESLSTSFSLQDIIELTSGSVCPEYPDKLWKINNQMNEVNLNNFPSCNCPSYTTPDNRYIDYASTSFFDLTNETSETECLLETTGNGIYAIIKLEDNCSIIDETYNCDTQAVFYGCGIDTREIYCTGLNNSHNFVSSGLTNSAFWSNITLTPGKYQVIVWGFRNSDSYTNDPFGSVKISKKIFDVIPPHYINLDVVSEPFDGFRIKSTTSFTSNNLFSSKKLYRYKFQSKDEVINTYTQWFPFMGDVNFKTSKGYSNGSNIVTYSGVYEAIVDEDNKNLGFINHELLDTKFPFHYVDDTNAKLHIEFSGYNNYGERESKTSIYNNDNRLVKKIVKKINPTNIYSGHQYNSADENIITLNEAYIDLVANQKVIDYFNDQSNSTKESEISFVYDDMLTAYKKPLLVQKTFGNEIEEYVYYNQVENYSSDYESKIVEIHNNIKGNTKYLFSNITGQLNGNPVTRYLTTEIQSSKPNEPLEAKTRFEYDTDGNMVSTVQVTPGTIANNQWDSFIYGYDNRFVVAKLTGIKYSDIPTALINDIKTASNQAITATSITAMETALSALRNSTDVNVKNAQITTYTYNPVFGVTSVTDPKGMTIYTEYDAFGRVKLTKEKTANGDLKILSENQYNTRPN